MHRAVQSLTLIGRTLSHFEITARLGVGGMGEVWRGSDTRLGREVAIKVLPEAFTEDPDRLARFEREARVLASLSHTNIAAIHDVGEEDGTHFLVMELAPGETLSDRIARGPLPIEEAIAIAGQIAEAVSVAHEQGVVHRDLKPGNVMVAPDGSIKVLDFGLAKALSPEAASGTAPELTLSPTLTLQDTAAGVILGTAAYMSPEQAKGRPIDRRSDVWSWGCVFYEMLAGEQAFGGETVPEILAAILRAEPAWEKLPSGLPAAAKQVLRNCLVKEPAQRLRDVADAKLLLEQAEEAPAPEPSAAPPRWRERLAWLLAATAVSAAAILGWLATRPEPPPPVTRFSVTLPEDAGLALIDQPILSVSPDGRTIAFVAVDPAENSNRLHLRHLEHTEVAQLPGTDGASSPFFSPDGKWLGFFAEGHLKKIPISGGTATVLAEAPNPRGAVWATNDSIIYSPLYTSGLWRVPAAGGRAEEVLPPDESIGERTFRWPELAPESGAILFTAGSTDSPNNYDHATIEVWSPETGERRVLIDGANMVRFLSADTLLFYRNSSLFALGFDPTEDRVVGAPTPVFDGVLGDPSSGAAYFAVGGEGSLAFAPGSSAAESSVLRIVERDGSIGSLELDPRSFHHPSFSPDGTRLAFTVGVGWAGASGDIWTLSLEDDSLSRLTFEEAGIHPLWSPDGEQIAYCDTGTSLLTKSSDGTGAPRSLTPADSGGVFLPGAWSPDGRTVAYTVLGRQTDLFLITEGEAPRLFENDASNPAFSPDGRWLAYAQPASGNSEVYVRPVQGEGKWQVSPNTGSYPRWTPGSREIFYIEVGSPQRAVMVVQVNDGEALRLGPPKVVLEDTSRFSTSTAPLANWDVSPDGQRFVFVELLRGEAAGSEIQVAVGWGRHLELPHR